MPPAVAGYYAVLAVLLFAVNIPIGNFKGKLCHHIRIGLFCGYYCKNSIYLKLYMQARYGRG